MRRGGGAADRSTTGAPPMGNKLGQRIDALLRLRRQRAEAERRVAALGAAIAAAEQVILTELAATGLTSGRGRIAQATASPHAYPVIDDYEKFTRYVRRADAFELLQRRPAVAAIRERWEANERVPGIGAVSIIKLNVTAIKRKEEE